MLAAAGPLLRSSLLDALPWIEHGFETAERCDWLDEEPVASLRQIHSSNVVFAAEPGELGAGDALITASPGLWVSVRTADCVPVLLADPESRAVAAIHSGWRGTAANIVGETIQALCGKFSTSGIKLHAAVGPSIGGCCYEVGPEVVDALARWSHGRDRNVDLRQVILAQLCEHSVTTSDLSTDCTRCHSGFHSFRRDGERAGRMRSAIRIKKQEGDGR